MTLESRVRSKDSCPVWGGGARKSAFQTVTRWRSTLLLVRFGEDFTSWEIMRAAVFNYIECDYNRWHRHSTSGALSPEQFENQNLA